MKKSKILNLVANFHELDELEGFVFVTTINEVHDQFKPEFERLEKARTNNAEYKKYQKEHTELLVKYTKKNDDGVPMIERNAQGETFHIEEGKQDILQKEAKALSKKYAKAITLQEELEEAFRKELEKEVGDSVPMLTKDDIPKNIKSRQYRLVSFLIEPTVKK